jgi:acetylornithine aminotransferase
MSEPHDAASQNAQPGRDSSGSPDALRAEALRDDPRVAEARRLLHEALAERQRPIDGPRPADPARRQSYEQTIERLQADRGGALFYPYLGSGIGQGALVELADGSVKYDMITGIGVHALGHNHPALLDAGLDAALADTVMQGHLQQNADAAELVRRFVDLARRDGGSLAHCFLSTSGAMANENALKLAFHAHQPADRVLAFDGAFMGRSIALAQVTDKPAYRAGLPPALAVDYVPFFDPDDPAGSTERALAALDRYLDRDPGRHAAMVFELIQGEGGFRVGDRDFFLALMDRLREKGIAVLADEVQTFGRTTRPFAFQHFGLADRADLVTVGQMTQVCATLFTDAYKPKPGLLSQTFTGSTASIHAGRRVLDHLDGGGFFGEEGRNVRIRQRFAERIGAIAERHPGRLSGPAGLGGMIAFKVFDGGTETTRRFLRALFDAGVVGFFTGGDPARVRFLPPIGAITDEEIDAVCGIVERTLATMAERE